MPLIYDQGESNPIEKLICSCKWKQLFWTGMPYCVALQTHLYDTEYRKDMPNGPVAHLLIGP